MTTEELEELKLKASRAGVTASDLIRKAIRKAAVVPPEELRAIRREVNRIGVNLNQVARALNRAPAGMNCLKVYEVLLRIQKDLWRLLQKVESGASFSKNEERYEGQAAVPEDWDEDEPIAV